MKKITSVLLIDDDEITNFINEKLLQEMSVADEVMVATNGKEGIDLLESRSQSKKASPELILLDINMPVMNGFEFLEKYQQIDIPRRPATKVVMLTSSNNVNDIEQSKQSSIVDYMNKPLTEGKLTTIFDKHFSSSSNSSF